MKNEKIPHNMKVGETKQFKNLQEIQDFCEKYEHDADEFQFIGVLIMEKIK